MKEVFSLLMKHARKGQKKDLPASAILLELFSAQQLAELSGYNEAEALIVANEFVRSRYNIGIKSTFDKIYNDLMSLKDENNE